MAERSTRRLPAVARLVAVVAVSLLSTALLAAAPAVADPGEPPFDPGHDWSLVGAEDDETSAGSAECEAGGRWTWTSGDREAVLYTVPCVAEESASGFWEWLNISGAVVVDAAEESELVLWDGEQVIRGWIADGGNDHHVLAVLTTSCPEGDRDRCVEQTASLSIRAMEQLPGGRGEVSTPGFTLWSVILTILVPLVLLAGPVGIWRVVVAMLRTRYLSRSESPRYHDVTSRTRRARWRRRIRRTVWWVVAFLVAVGVTALTTRNMSELMGIAIFLVPLLVIMWLGYRRFLRVDPVERSRRATSGLGLGAGVGTAISVLAVGLVGMIVLVHVLLAGYGPMSLGWPSLARADVRHMDLPMLVGMLPLVRSLGDDASFVSSVLAVPALALVAALDAFGQRLRSASVDEALAQDDRPHYLYLRSFDEDRLKLPGQLHRRGLLASLSVMRRVRFEEVLVRQLSATGPVIAIAPPGSSMPAIGAARASFSNDEWQQHVHRYAETARAVVLSATPGQVREGYGWELDLVANRIGHQRVMVVLGPWTQGNLRRRWTQFCQAVSHVPFFAPITMPWVPDGVHVLAHSAGQGWHAWGARQRLDWTYAIAIDEATRAYMPEWS